MANGGTRGGGRGVGAPGSCMTCVHTGTHTHGPARAPPPRTQPPACCPTLTPRGSAPRRGASWASWGPSRTRLARCRATWRCPRCDCVCARACAAVCGECGRGLGGWVRGAAGAHAPLSCARRRHHARATIAGYTRPRRRCSLTIAHRARAPPGCVAPGAERVADPAHAAPAGAVQQVRHTGAAHRTAARHCGPGGGRPCTPGAVHVVHVF